MKGFPPSKNNKIAKIRTNSLGLNEVKVSELILHIDKANVLPAIDKEKRYSHNDGKHPKLLMMRKIFKKNENKENNKAPKKESERIIEISVANFKNKVFKRKVRFNSNDMSNFEDEQIEVKSQGTSTVKSGSPVLWLKNRNKKSDKKVQVDNKPLKIEIKVVLPRDIYKFGELIVKNNFCKINRGLNILNGETIVIKSYTDNKYLTSQINILKNLNHTNIIKLIDNDESNIYLEYISGGSLKSLIEKYGNLSETLIKKYTRQTVAGLAYLHSKSIVHNNLKLSNILIDTNGVVKLNDFSEAKSFSVDEHFRTQSDYQSLVYIILEMLCEDVNINYEDISTNCKDFINTLFKIIPDPLKLLEHPFLN